MFRLMVLAIVAIGAFSFGAVSARQEAQDSCLDAGGKWRAGDGVCIGIDS